MDIGWGGAGLLAIGLILVSIASAVLLSGYADAQAAAKDIAGWNHWWIWLILISGLGIIFVTLYTDRHKNIQKNKQ